MINFIALLIPVFFVIIGIEWYISNKHDDKKYETGNTFMNMSLGLIDQISQLGYLVIFYFILDFLYAHFRIINIPITWYHWVLAFVAVDFISYWYHRFSHEMNIFWAGHVTHHSSELYNLTIGFRISIFQGINRILFWLILPVLGLDPFACIVSFKIAGVYQFFLHTEYLGKMGWLEYFLVTPSQHRVHHGKNDIYIDKNYGSFFNIWDKLFGTFQEETEPVIYGIKGTYEDNHPLVAIGHHYMYLQKIIKATPKWTDKIKILIKPPGWLPSSTKSIETKSIKKTCKRLAHFKSYAYFQVLFATLGVVAFAVFKDFFSLFEILLCGSILIHSIVKGTLIIKENLSKKWLENEFLLLWVQLTLIVVAMLLFAKIYLLLLFVFLVFSLTFLRTKCEQLKWKVA